MYLHIPAYFGNCDWSVVRVHTSLTSNNLAVK